MSLCCGRKVSRKKRLESKSPEKRKPHSASNKGIAVLPNSSQVVSDLDTEKTSRSNANGDAGLGAPVSSDTRNRLTSEDYMIPLEESNRQLNEQKLNSNSRELSGDSLSTFKRHQATDYENSDYDNSGADSKIDSHNQLPSESSQDFKPELLSNPSTVGHSFVSGLSSQVITSSESQRLCSATAAAMNSADEELDRLIAMMSDMASSTNQSTIQTPLNMRSDSTGNKVNLPELKNVQHSQGWMKTDVQQQIPSRVSELKSSAKPNPNWTIEYETNTFTGNESDSISIRLSPNSMPFPELLQLKTEVRSELRGRDFCGRATEPVQATVVEGSQDTPGNLRKPRSPKSKLRELPSDTVFMESDVNSTVMEATSKTLATNKTQQTPETKTTSSDFTSDEKAVDNSVFTFNLGEYCLRLNSNRDTLGSDSSSVDLVLETPGSAQSTNVSDQFKVHRLAVLKATSKLLDFVGEIWRKKESLQEKVPKVSLLCLHLKNSLQELENFGLYLISNMTEEERKGCEKKMLSHTKLLLNIRNGINRYLDSLKPESHDTSAQADSGESWGDDSLKTKVVNIILLTKVIPGLVRAFGSFVDDVSRLTSSSSPKEGSTASETRNSPDAEVDLQQSQKSRDRKQTIGSTEIAPALPPKQSQLQMNLQNQTGYDNVINFAKEEYLHVSSLSDTFGPSPASGHRSTHDRATDRPNRNGIETSPVRGLPAQPDRPSLVRDQNTAEISELASENLPDYSQTTVVLRQKPINQTKTTENVENIAENEVSDSEFSNPEIRTSGVSMTVQVRLEELQRQAKGQSVQLHTDNDCNFMDYDVPAGIMEENLPDLCETDRKLLLFYSDEMFNHWKVLDNAAAGFFQCIEKSQPPKVFVTYSKFVIVAGHKMAFIGDVLARNLIDAETRNWLIDSCNDFCDRLKHAVRATKQAALAFPAVLPLQLMVDAVKEVTDSSYELRELLFRLTYIGKTNQAVTW